MIDKGLNYSYPMRFAEGGDVKAAAPSGITRARDSSGDVVPGMFVARYADGTFSAPVTAGNIESLRQGIIRGEVTTGAYSADEAARLAEKNTYLKRDNVNVVDADVSALPGAMSNEAIGNDTVFVQFADGSRATAQKGMIDAFNEYGLFDNIQSLDDFNKTIQDMSVASGSAPDSNLGRAFNLFNDRQISYNNALLESNPQLARNRLSFVQQYAPNNSAGVAAAQSLVDKYSAPAAAAPAALGSDFNFGLPMGLSPEQFALISRPPAGAMGQPGSGGIASLLESPNRNYVAPVAPGADFNFGLPMGLSPEQFALISRPPAGAMGQPGVGGTNVVSPFYRASEMQPVPGLFGESVTAAPVTASQVRAQDIQNPFVRR